MNTAHEEFRTLADTLSRRSMLIELETLNCIWDEADEYCLGRDEDRVYTEEDIAVKAMQLWRERASVFPEVRRRT